jgi:CheY-like chemotaxis protein
MVSRQTTILCIDDELEILAGRKRLLEMHGYRVITASSGVEALRMLSEGQTVDLVLLDYIMPEMAGDRVAEELKRLYPSLPIVAVSGFPELPEHLLKSVDGFVRKGQDPEVVLVAISNALTARQF